MATLKALQIRGIRSFGPDDEDVQYVSFEKPFSLILGRNGCGKTTIIEALKYACTGNMPIGGGANFVRDPKLSKSVSVLGQVKLEFVSCHGTTQVITRSLQATQKAKSVTVKTLDTTSQVIVDGKEGSLSGRHVDMDELMSKSLGVSKAILNYVIFCHQEDSFWPLDTGMKVKERFDEIFDAIKYNKCLKEIREQRNKTLADIRVAKEGFKHLQDKLSIVMAKRAELEDFKSRLRNSEVQMEQFQKDVDDCNRERDHWYKKYQEYDKVKSLRVSAKNDLEKLQHECDTLKSVIKLEFTKSEDELLQTISNFDGELESKKESFKQNENKIREVDSFESQIQSKVATIINKIGSLEAELRSKTKTEEQRNFKLSNLAETLGLPKLADTPSATHVQDLMNKVKRELNKLTSSINDLRRQQEREQESLQEEIKKCREEKSRLETEITLKTGNISTVADDIKKLDEKLQNTSRSRNRLTKIDDELSKRRLDHDKVLASENSQDLTNQIEKLRVVCLELEERSKALTEEALNLCKLKASQDNLKQSEQKYNEIQMAIRGLRNKNDEFISVHLSNSADDSIRYDLENKIRRVRREIAQLESQVNSKNHETLSLEQERKLKKELLRKKQDELSRNEESLRSELGGRKVLDEVLSSIQSEMESLQNDKGAFEASRFVYSRQIKDLERENSCPLCNRAFNDESGSAQLIEELNSKMKGIPLRLEETDEKLSKLKDKHRKLLQLKPLEKIISNLKAEIPKLQEEIVIIEDKLDAAHFEVAQVQASLISPQEILKAAEMIQNDIIDIDHRSQESKQMLLKIEKLKRECPVHVTTRSSDEAISEQQVVQDELSACRKEKSELEERLRAHEKQINTLNNQINLLVSEQLQIKEQVSQEEAMRERLTEFTALREVLETELGELNQKLQPVIEKTLEVEKRLDDVKGQHLLALQRREREKIELEKGVSGILDLQKSLEDLDSHNIEGSLQENKAKHEGLLEKVKALKEKRETLNQKSKALDEDIKGHSQHKQELVNILKVMQIEKKIDKQRGVFQSLSERLGSLDELSIRDKYVDLDKQHIDLTRKMSEFKGTLHGLKENIQSRERELKQEPFRTAEPKHREKFIEIEILQQVEKDLQKYYNALDYALQHFHKDRMDTINKFIREFWRLIYKGNDIDYIEIKTDESAASGTAYSSTEKKRMYNYRVVQVKNGVEIDMKGRCSAGQKVLACLIIRMALAETFSANCGILTLDEPTTNLDKENIRSLSQAIAEIVNGHEAQKYFQLVVITHDQEFLKAVSHLDCFTHYLEVTRNHQSKSVVKRKEVIRE